MGKTPFRPQTNGFAFVNSWKFSPEEDTKMKQTLALSANSVAGVQDAGFGALFNRTLKPVLRRWLKGALPEYYGLCGGMADAALDYYRAGKPLPRGAGYNDVPTDNTPEGQALRSYLLRRQLESMALNFPKLLLWMAILNIDLPFIEGDGPRWLVHHSLDEWAELKGHLDGGSPWPLMLIGNSTSPFNNHQVLAYGYDEPSDGKGVIYVYDMNCPDHETTIALDFTQSVLEAQESCPNTARGPLRGFFCNIYQPVEPPVVAAPAP